jgi:lysophospholipase L1-like esterase
MNKTPFGADWIAQSPMGLMASMLLLAPVLFVQGIYVRRSTPRLPEPDGAREGQTGRGAPLRLLLLGDSAAAGVGVASQNEALSGQTVRNLEDRFDLRWKLVARTGATTLDALQFVHALPPEPFDAVVISLGVNDVTSGRIVNTWLQQIEELAARLRAKLGARQIILSSLPPMHSFPALPQPLRWFLGARALQFNRALERWAATQSDCEFMRLNVAAEPGMMASDGYHPGPPIYAAWGAEVARRIIARWGKH